MSELDRFESDTLGTSEGDLTIVFLGHGSLLFQYAEQEIYVDPYGRVADYGGLPKANVIFITHDHQDHLDPKALAQVRMQDTVIIHAGVCEGMVQGGVTKRNGNVTAVNGLTVEAVPAYNVLHMREGGDPFHPRGDGNGYVIAFGDKRVYVAGDTENTPEMKMLRDIEVAFLPMNLPYTMTSEMVADAARAIRPKILYPYHFGSTDTSEVVELLSGTGIDVRIRKMG